MNKWVLISISYVVLVGSLYWSVESKGKLKAQVDQFAVTVEEMASEANQQREQVNKDNKLHAEARKEAERINDESDRLRQKLEALGGCAARRIDDDSAAWLQQDDN